MKKSTLVLLVICLTLKGFGQNIENEKIIALGSAYDRMFDGESLKEKELALRKDVPDNLKSATDFVVQTMTPHNNLLTQQYLALPDNKTLKYIYLILSVHYNVLEKQPKDNNKLIDSLRNSDIQRNELIEAYYSMLFGAVSNMNKPFNLSKINFTPDTYNLNNVTEKSIFFLSCIQSCYVEIFGYMNVVNPPNTNKALKIIKKYPKFNGKEYYTYSDLDMTDFEMVIDKDKGKESYKHYYINIYYNLLLSHLVCLTLEKAKQKDLHDLFYGSILSNRSYYPYTGNKETLEKIFQSLK